jgi:hypothetical protein
VDHVCKIPSCQSSMREYGIFFSDPFLKGDYRLYLE